jgi:hypothetical protein
MSFLTEVGWLVNMCFRYSWRCLKALKSYWVMALKYIAAAVTEVLCLGLNTPCTFLHSVQVIYNPPWAKHDEVHYLV